MKTIIVCDIDGTIADLSHRLKYIRPDHPEFSGKKDWASFHAGVVDDTPHKDVKLILTTLTAARNGVIYMSGRNEVSRKDTEMWLYRHGFPHGQVYMRADGDFRDDAIVKEEIIDRMGLTPDMVLCVLDDRDRVVAMWRRRGFRCLQVAPGSF
jgi:hypothetical protein